MTRSPCWTAGTRGARLWSPQPQPATPDNVRAAVAFLEHAHLIGALDLGNALAAAEPPAQVGRQSVSGPRRRRHRHLGERREDLLAQRIPQGTRYIGIGVGKKWSRQFMKTAAASTGGYVTQINPDEQVRWRAFEVLSTLNSPRLLGIKVADDAERITFLSYSDSIAQGEELCAVARLDGSGPMPGSVIATGTLDGKPWRQLIPVQNVTGKAAYLPRTWAKLEIDRLLADNPAANMPRIIELSKAMYVMSPFTSLLVLENEQMYAQYNIDRGRKDHWAMYPSPDQVPVVYEPVDPRAIVTGPSTATTNAIERIGIEQARTVQDLIRQGRQLIAQTKYRDALGVLDQVLAVTRPTNMPWVSGRWSKTGLTSIRSSGGSARASTGTSPGN